jgi:hypothetical protein
MPQRAAFLVLRKAVHLVAPLCRLQVIFPFRGGCLRMRMKLASCVQQYSAELERVTASAGVPRRTFLPELSRSDEVAIHEGCLVPCTPSPFVFHAFKCDE